MKKGLFSEKEGGNSVNEGFGKDFYSKGKSRKRSVNRRTLKTEKLLSSSPPRKSALSLSCLWTKTETRGHLQRLISGEWISGMFHEDRKAQMTLPRRP